jgi:hypothetical protein
VLANRSNIVAKNISNDCDAHEFHRMQRSLLPRAWVRFQPDV